MSLDLIESGSFVQNDGACNPTDQLSIVSWNIARGTRLDEVIKFLRAANADLICLQEVDRNARRTGRRNIAAEIAAALRMNYSFGVEFEELSDVDKELRAHHGQATLSTFPLTNGRILRFSNQSRFWHPYWFVPNLAVFQRRIGGRMALATDLQIGAKTVRVYNIHFESRSERVRQAQLSEAIEQAGRCDGSTQVVIAGDFNLDAAEHSASAVIDAAGFNNPLKNKIAQTTPTTHFGRKDAIDWVLFKGPMRVAAAQVHDSVKVSDHYPLSVTLKML